MAKQISGDRMDFKIRTPRGSSDYAGSVEQGIELAFCYVGTPERRLSLLVKLQQMHERLVVREAEDAAIAAASPQ
jgi:hypothetical protein